MKYFNQLFEEGIVFFLCFTILSLLIIRILTMYVLKILHKKSHSNTVLIDKIVKGIGWIVWLYLILLQIKPLQKFTLSLLASGGILAVIIGFASQDSVSNLISGLFIIIFKPFVIGDVVKVENGLIIGTVENITLRHTIIRTFENTKQVISNARLNALTIENITDFKDYKGSPLLLLLDNEVTITKAIDIIENCITENKKVVKHSPILVTNITNAGIEVRSMIFAESIPSTNEALSEIRTQVLIQFQKNNIQLSKNPILK